MKIDLHCHTKATKSGDGEGRNVTPSLFKEKIENSDVKIIENSSHYTIAECCHPIPGDSVIGFKTADGYEIHSQNCPIAIEKQLTQKAEKIKWISRQEQVFLTSIQIKGKDKIDGILKN